MPYLKDFDDFCLGKLIYKENKTEEERLESSSKRDNSPKIHEENVLDSILEHYISEMIIDYLNLNESESTDTFDHQTIIRRGSFIQRRIHLANKFDMNTKTWNLENSLEV